MNQINDYVIHKDYHIYKIIDLNKTIFTLQTKEQTIKATAKDLVRKIRSKEEIEEIIERIPYIRTLEITSERFREEVYQKAMNKYDEIEWIKLIKTIYIRTKKEQAQKYEQEYLKTAQTIFHHEVALALNISFNQVDEYIKRKIEAF